MYFINRPIHSNVSRYFSVVLNYVWSKYLPCSISAEDFKFIQPLVKFFVLPALSQMSQHIYSIPSTFSHQNHLTICFFGSHLIFCFLEGRSFCFLICGWAEVFAAVSRASMTQKPCPLPSQTFPTRQRVVLFEFSHFIMCWSHEH